MKRGIVLAAIFVLGLIASPFLRDTARGLLPGNVESVSAGEILEGLKETNRLTVFRAYITALSETRDKGWIFDSTQLLITPAFVNYYVDLASMKPGAIVIADKTMTVTLPPIMLERPNIDAAGVRKIDRGALTAFASESDALRAANTAKAYAQLTAKARTPSLLKAAREQAKAAFAANARAILEKKGFTEMTIKVEVK